MLLQAQPLFDGAIHRHEGYVAQRAGHGLLVYFGYPQAHENDAHRAVRAGLAIVQALSQMHQQTPESDARLNVRIGIHTGLVIVREIDHGDKREQLALGHAPYVATQLASFAEPNTVVISPSTLQVVDGYMVCEPIGSYLFDELSESLGVYQVLHESDARDRIDVGTSAQLTSFIGREQELNLLCQRWEQVKIGHGQVVMLSGEAGIGKSRILHRLRDELADETHTWIACRCSQDTQQSAFYPVIEHLQRVMQIRREDEATVKLRKLERALEQYRFVLDEVVPLLAPLCSVPLSEPYAPLRLSPPRQKQCILEALLKWFLQEAEWQSSCLVIEDIHWADPSTQTFLNLLIDHIPTTRLMIILTFRPTFLAPQP